MFGFFFAMTLLFQGCKGREAGELEPKKVQRQTLNWTKGAKLQVSLEYEPQTSSQKILPSLCVSYLEEDLVLGHGQCSGEDKPYTIKAGHMTQVCPIPEEGMEDKDPSMNLDWDCSSGEISFEILNPPLVFSQKP